MGAATATALDVSMLAGRVRGALIGPEDAAYEKARKVYNGSIDRGRR